MKSLTQLMVIAGISLAAVASTFFIKGSPRRLFYCNPATLKAGEVCLEQIPPGVPVLWVDARSRAEWEISGVPESALWNLDPTEDIQAFEADVAMRIMTSPRVIVYCGDENCGLSRQIADRIIALQLGANVSVLRGGWRALKEAGRIKDSNPAF
jgi:rhodanese-related sulfurtransferase